MTMGTYLLIQLIEGNVLMPMMMRNSVGLSPFLVLLSLLIGGTAGGILGAVVAVPDRRRDDGHPRSTPGSRDAGAGGSRGGRDARRGGARRAGADTDRLRGPGSAPAGQPVARGEDPELAHALGSG